MVTAPKLLTEYVSTDSIIPVENAPVKVLPASLPCPSRGCGSKNGFTLYNDTASAVGSAVWGFCTSCGITGDVVDLYRHKVAATTPLQAIRELLDKGWINEQSAVTDKLCFDYDIVRQIRTSIENFWDASRIALRHMPKQHPVLVNLGLQDNQSFQLLGSTTRAELNNVFRSVNLNTSKKILLVPYQDIPGRISLFRAYYVHGTETRYVDIPTPYSHEPGLFMLSAARPHSDMVLAVDDPLFAFQIQNHCMMSNSIPWPVVACTDSSANWDTVQTSKVVFWVSAYNVDVFQTAKRAPNAHLSLAPAAVDKMRQMRNMSVKMWSTDILSRAVPWLSALGTWLCRIKREDAAYAIRELKLTPTQRQDLIDSGSSVEASQLLKDLLLANTQARSTEFKGAEIVERDGCWYSVSKGNQSDKLISDTIVKLRGTVCLSEGAGNYYKGLVVRRGSQQVFYAPTDMPPARHKKWVEDFCIEHDMGCPEITQSWGSTLFSIARTFAGELDNENREGKVGWSKDLLSFNMPKRIIKDGAIIPEVGIPVPTYPCQHVTGRGLSTAALRSVLEPTKSNAQFWALFACTMMNATAQFFGLRKRKIGSVGQHNFAFAFANAMDFNTAQVTKRTYATQPLNHDIPLNMMLDHVKFTDVARWLNDPEEKNILVGLNYLQAMQIADDDWVFVHSGDFSKINDVVGVRDLIPHAIKFVQTCKHKLTTFSPDIFLHGFRKLLSQRFFNGEHVDFSVMDEASKLISSESPLGTTYGQSFLYGLFFMAQNGDIEIDRLAYGNTVVTGNTDVTIPKTIVNKAVLDGCTQRVGQSLLEDSAGFSADYTAWRISRAYWDATFNRFQKEHIF